ncbi:MAG: cupin domain-containing protein [Spirochaetales bacterium]|nr:cupin domain-containing protein [Spirochaetales bacterium]
MFVSHINRCKEIPVNMEGVKNVVKKVLVGPQQGWQDHSMRAFTIKKGGNTPLHSHPWLHVNYVISGTGRLTLSGKDYDLTQGSIAYVPGGTEHQFKNSGDEDFTFICIVPAEGDK